MLEQIPAPGGMASRRQLSMPRGITPRILLAVGSIGLVATTSADGAEPKQRTVILSTTTSTHDSGLLDVLNPLFEKQSGYTGKPTPVGTGQAHALAPKGDTEA